MASDRYALLIAATLVAGLAGTALAAQTQRPAATKAAPARPAPAKAAPAKAAPQPAPAPERREAVGDTAEDIVTQPVEDLGLDKAEIPPVLLAAAQDPYTVTGVTTCVQLANAVKALNAELGPDFGVGVTTNESRAAQIAAAGGRALVNSVIPFRGLVREVTGAAPAQRRLDAAIAAGVARRGFLRGLHRKQGCRTAF
jgi:hypothetical protein